MLENRVEKKFRKAVERIGGIAIKLEATYCAGVPDRLVILPGGKIKFVELKASKGGRFRKRQKHWKQKLERFGCDVLVIKNADEIEEFIQEVSNSEVHSA